MSNRIPYKKKPFRVELYTNGSTGRYHSQLTVHVADSSELNDFVDLLKSTLRSTKTRVKIKSGEKSKSITLPYGVEHIKRELKRLAILNK